MTNVSDTIANDEPLTTTEVPEVAAAPEVEAPAPAEAETPKTDGLDAALAKAFEKHTPTEDGKVKTVTSEPPAPTTKVVDPITGRESEPMKAPAGWTPLLKEKWGTIDPTVQKFIADREKDMAQTISKTADARKLESDFKAAMAPYDATIRQFNVPALNVVKDVMNQWHAMQTGSAQAKAQIMHNMIQHFKPDIPTLIALSNGQAPQVPLTPQQPQKSVDQLVEERLAAQQEQQIAATAQTGIQQFEANPANEFFGAVKEQMGKIINAELVTGDSMPELLQKAYDLACSQNPEVQQVMKQRSAVNATRPVGSIKPSLGSGVKSNSAPKRMSLDEAIQRAIKDHSQ